jgi:hypothetical protein
MYVPVNIQSIRNEMYVTVNKQSIRNEMYVPVSKQSLKVSKFHRPSLSTTLRKVLKTLSYFKYLCGQHNTMSPAR